MSFLRRLCSPPTALALLLAVALGFGTVAAYAPACRNDFLHYDDNRYVTDNPQVKAGLSWDGLKWACTTTEMANWCPLTWLSLMADAQLCGLDAAAFHRTNVILHAVDAVLLFLLLRRLTAATGRSLFVAAFFALHPLHVESVAWVSERKDVLSTLFGLLALYAYARYADRPRLGRYLPVALALALSLLAKPMLVTLPFLLLLLDYWPLQRVASKDNSPPSSLAALLLEKLPLLLLVAASCAATTYAQQQAIEGPPPEGWPVRLESAAINCVTYLGKTFWPRDLVPFYPAPRELFPFWQVAAAVTLLAAISALALGLRKRCPYLLVGWLWYLGTLAPVSGVVHVVGGHSLADRYTYFPLIGVFLALVWAAADLCRRLRIPSPVPALAGSLLLGACVLLTQSQIAYWHDNVTLWTHTLQVDPTNPVAHNGLAALAYNQGHIDEAVTHLEAALSANPRYDLAHTNLARALWDRGQIDQAIQHWQTAVAISPRETSARLALAAAYTYRGQTEEALGEYEEAVRLAPDSAAARYYLGSALAQAGRRREAVEQYERAARLAPGWAALRQSLAAGLLEEGEVEEAVRQYEEALRLDAGLTDAHTGLAAALVRQGKLDEAERHCGAALRLEPRAAQAEYLLGIVGALRGQGAEALGHFRRAVGVRPDVGPYAYGLALALQDSGKRDEAALWYRWGTSRHADWLPTANDTAWALATSPDAGARNGPLAVWLARQACAATAEQNADYLDTLAAAYAEDGRFDQAEAAARQARALLLAAGEDAKARVAEGRVAQYRKHEALRASAGGKWEMSIE